MVGIETRLAGKIDTLESSVRANKETIVVLTDSVNKNTIDLANLESQMKRNNEQFESRAQIFILG